MDSDGIVTTAIRSGPAMGRGMGSSMIQSTGQWHDHKRYLEKRGASRRVQGTPGSGTGINR